ncbi:rRNA maturation RNase YbeY [Solicola gregarius]|uniref:Endoribonuclease YbeY n=1 Tax=Solicola gregarius TaxID=2908642 RepID=A0AA46YLQ3_9ACTN|nr:rRNA maturation RNase YbeY [Solicola gregarius]UYM05741.1 rRNA maturation RNase YbeY [Solicola gregarius]
MNVDVLDESGTDVEVARLARLSRFVMSEMRLHPATEMSIRLVDTDTIATMNHQWMGHEGPTDVLSFPLDELTPGRDDAPAPQGYLGDIALCVAYAATQAPQNGNTTLQEVELLTVHGILHLLGYDHAEPEEHREMFGLQAELLGRWRERPLEADA